MLGMCFFRLKAHLPLILLLALSSVLSVSQLDTDATGFPIQSSSGSLGDRGFHLSGLEESWPVPL